MNKSNINQEEFINILDKAKEKLYQKSTKIEPLIYFMSNDFYFTLEMKGLLHWYCQTQLLHYGFTQLCLVERKKNYMKYYKMVH